MKLIFCPACQDVVKLQVARNRYCDCKQSWGYYHKDGLNAEIGGSAVPLGFDNQDFVRALRAQPESGWGVQFNAFVIPKQCPTITNL